MDCDQAIQNNKNNQMDTRRAQRYCNVNESENFVYLPHDSDPLQNSMGSSLIKNDLFGEGNKSVPTDNVLTRAFGGVDKRCLSIFEKNGGCNNVT